MLLEMLTLVAAQFAPDPAVVQEFDGRCTYPPGLGEPGLGEIRATCNRVTVDDASVVFGSRDWGDQVRFSGTFQGDRLAVQTVTPRAGDPVAVRGLCRVFYADDKVSVISCTAVEQNGPRSWIANFVPWEG